MNYTKLFYWLTVADNAKTFFTIVIIIFTAIAAVSTIIYFILSDDKAPEGAQKMARKWMWWSYPFAFLFWSLYIFTPSKRDSLLIVAGGQTMNFLTTDSSAKRIPSELTNFVVTELKNMAEDAKVELNISNQREKILEKAKNMSASELIEQLKTDSALRNIILK